MEIGLIVLLVSLVIGILGANRKFGFWGYFFCSLALTPCIGVLALLASDKREKPPLDEGQA